jgi:protein ImuA
VQTALPLQPEVFCSAPAAPAIHRRQDVWPAHMLARDTRCWTSGHAALDAQLPGGGWPLEGMVELLQARMHLQAGTHLWALLAPALARRLQAHQNRKQPVVLIGAPQQPFGPALRAQGLASDRLLCIHTDTPAARLWAAEQALRCADIAAVLAWLPQAKATQLQRLNVLAQDRLLFVMRNANTQHDASPARLRIVLGGADQMELRILKRRGPPLAQPIYLPAQSDHLQRLLESRPKQELAPSRIAIVRVATQPPLSLDTQDALDRAAAA